MVLTLNFAGAGCVFYSNCIEQGCGNLAATVLLMRGNIAWGPTYWLREHLPMAVIINADFDNASLILER